MTVAGKSQKSQRAYKKERSPHSNLNTRKHLKKKDVNKDISKDTEQLYVGNQIFNLHPVLPLKMVLFI